MEGSRYAATASVVVIAVCFGLTAATAGPAVPPLEFIRSSCRMTRYPDLCVKSLSSYTPPLQRRSPRLLAHAALTVTAQRAASASIFVKRMSGGSRKRSAAPRGARDGGAMRDCSEVMSDSAERLQRSVTEMQHMGRRGGRSFAWHLGNVQTWVSAALTDENTCLDSLTQDRAAATAAVGPQIRRQIVYVTQLTSNALALINRLDPTV